MKLLKRLAQKNLNDHDLLSDIVKINKIVQSLQRQGNGLTAEPSTLMLNPTIQPYEATFSGIAQLFENPDLEPTWELNKHSEILLIWWDPNSEQVRIEPATESNLLVLKILEENIDAKDVARIGNLPLGAVDAAIEAAVHKGLVLRPRPRIRRNEKEFFTPPGIQEQVIEAGVFTLQWHLTQQCDLHCKHCYDRSKRSPLTLEQGLAVIDQLRDFCRAKFVSGQISFSGGNPLLYANFLQLYKRAVEYGFIVSILGNPTSRSKMEEIIGIQRPEFYQVSLEGLPAHNDAIRGRGHFERTIRFLELLRELGIYSMVMLTLTRDNLPQVLPLAQILKDKVDLFTFNRLSMVGEGASLHLPSADEYKGFLATYLSAMEDNPAMVLKDNLFNIMLRNNARPLFGGCTGYGCGAAFNFLALLPDGEVHACRKFPSFLGNIHDKSLLEIYDSEVAERYRKGPEACGSCEIKAVCRGCLAIAYSFGLDIFAQKDPFCYI